MCGICGMFDFRGKPVDASLLDRMAGVLRHRGPDGSGRFIQGDVALGHRRLSIIDLEGGAQPISNEDGSLQIVFNGEIYNFIELRRELEAAGHAFRTRSDTEVIIHAFEQWGLDAVRRFNGIFAFALWDAKERRLILARDHLGVKPLYYTQVGSRLLFASEIKALLQDDACARNVDLRSLGSLFTLRYVPSPDTLFEGIKKIPPAHLMVVDASGIQAHRYWNWTPKIRDHYREADLVEEYQELVEDAVRLQMRSDVPVGLFLSSGIDSGAILAIMTRYTSKPVHTFTIGFEDGERTNEIDGARCMAERFGADHDEMMVTSRDYLDYYERYLWHLEEPVGNETAAAFYFVSLIASRKVKVALTGQGADEPWAGYPRYLGVKLSAAYSRLPLFFTRGLAKPLVERFAKNELLKRGVASLDEPDILARLVKIYSFYSTAMKEQLFQPWVKEQISADGTEARQSLARLHDDVHELDPLTRMLYIDTRANLPDDLLMVGDKTAMANSLEARVPFLDYRLVEFVESLPPRLKLRRFEAKYLHKKAVEKWLPKSVIYRKKKGFANPIDKWLRTRMSHYVRERLLSEGAAVQQYFSREYIQKLLSEHQSGQQEYQRHIYLLISFELWHEKFISQPVLA
jgi:asparagine synthase (glutamine-hydrolysing)